MMTSLYFKCIFDDLLVQGVQVSLGQDTKHNSKAHKS